MKKILRILPVVALLSGIFGVASTKTDSIRADAAWNDETVRIYLDKTTTIAGLGWWQTDNTYIHIWDGTTDTYELMSKLSDNVFYYDILDATWDLMIDASRGIEFYVYNRESPQNQTYFTDGLYLKTNEFNYFKLNSANESAKQSYIIQNKEVEETITSILVLNCASTPAQVQSTINMYQALRPLGKSNLNTWTVAEADVTFYQRLSYFADYNNVTMPAPTNVPVDSKRNVGLIMTIGAIGITALAGFYFLKSKKQ